MLQFLFLHHAFLLNNYCGEGTREKCWDKVLEENLKEEKKMAKEERFYFLCGMATGLSFRDERG